MERLLADIRYGLRGLRANPALTAVAVLSLAVGIGPTSAIFSVVDGLGFRPLPIADPAQLIVIDSRAEGAGRQGVRDSQMSYPDYLAVRDGARVLAAVAAEGPLAVGFSHDRGAPEVVIGSIVSGNYFQTLGVEAAIGRTFLPEEDGTPRTHPVTVISDRLWARLFDRSPGAVGDVVRLNTTAFTIIGVMPPGFTGTSAILAPELWVPAMAWPLLDRGGAGATLEARGRREMTVLARAQAGVTIEQVDADVGALGVRLAEAWPATNARRRLVAEYEQASRRRLVGLIGLFSIGVVSLILVTAAANVAGLLIGRADARRQEMAIRAALGARRGQLVRQVLTESALLAVAAAAAGLALAYVVVQLLPSLVPPMPLAMNLDFRIDVRVLVFTISFALLALPVFALGPALLTSRANLAVRLNAAAWGTGRRLLFRNALVAMQVAITLVLLVAAGLVVRGLVNARTVDPGFVARPMVFATMSPGVLGYDETRSQDFYRRLVDELGIMPGIERVTLARHMPLNTLYGGGAVLEAGELPLPVRYNTIGAGYFQTMGTRILRGRAFDERDRRGSTPVAIVNDQLARRLWPDGHAVGQSLRVKPRGRNAVARDVEVVGVAQDGRYLRLTEDPQPYVYLPWAQQFSDEMTVIARFSGSPDAAADGFRRALQAVDPAIPTLGLVTLDEHLRLALLGERVTALLIGTLGGLGLLLSVVGLYGVLAYLVTRRTREIGIRMALGAGPARIVAAVVGHGARPALIGLVAGLALGGAAARVVASSLYGVSAADPLVFGGATALVAAIVALAAWIPARRAARVDPMSALRG
jgi:macrolide transport system ATP-binding/permease protein